MGAEHAGHMTRSDRSATYIGVPDCSCNLPLQAPNGPAPSSSVALTILHKDTHIPSLGGNLNIAF